LKFEHDIALKKTDGDVVCLILRC